MMRSAGWRGPRRLALVAVAVLTLQGCATLSQLAAPLLSLQKIRFKLGQVRNFTLVGIPIGSKADLGDFSLIDGLALAQAFRAKKLPAAFVLDVLAVNPNTGETGTTKTLTTLTALESRLLIDDTPTVTGNIERPIDIPGTGQETAIPISLSLDLWQTFGAKGYDDVLRLALAIGGAKGSAARLALDAQPTVTTPIGPITYPGRLTIISKEFR